VASDFNLRRLLPPVHKCLTGRTCRIEFFLCDILKSPCSRCCFFASHATISIFKVKPVGFLSDSVSCGVVASGFTYSSHTHLAEPSVGFHMDGNQTVPPSRTCHSAAERNLCSLWVRYTGASTSEELQSWT
jgi:hypothetical protein